MKSQEVENRTLFTVRPAYEAQQCKTGCVFICTAVV